MKAWITKSFALECFQGIHDFRGDIIKMACFAPGAPIDVETAAYDVYYETSGPGYVSGGQIVSIVDGYPRIDENLAGVRFEDVIWPGPATFTYRKALIYNATKDNRSIIAIDFSLDRGPLNASHKISTPVFAPPVLAMSFGLV